MGMRRAILAASLGAATTFLVAAAGPHLWFRALRPAWASGPVAGVTAATPYNAITMASRPLVDLYTVSPAPYAVAAASPQPPEPPPGVQTGADPAVYVRVDTALCGWPLRALASEAWVPANGPVEFRCNWHLTTTADGPVLVPLRPLPGFVADTALYGAAWWGVLLAPVLSPGWWRSGRRLRRGCCPACGYDLRWALAGGCPECGWRPAR